MSDEQMLSKAVSLLYEAVPPGSKVILIGSHATGNARPDSDWDFLVLEPFVEKRWAEMTRLSERLGQALIPADVIVMSQELFERWQDTPNTLASIARKEGRILENVP